MKSLIAVAFAATLCVTPAIAQDKQAAEKKAPTEQQQRMADCNKRAGEKDMKGDDRKSFMSACLKGEQPMTQQDKMKACNKQAGDNGMKGDDRKKFMSSCLSG
jgi:hypothetical protein